MNIKSWLIVKLGGYATIRDLVESVPAGDEKRQLLTEAIRKHFNTIGPDDILKVHTSGQWLFMGKALDDGIKRLIIAEASQFLQTRLWAVLQADIKYQANKKMFLTASKPEDVDNGKFWLYILDAIRTRLNSLHEGSGTFNNKKK